MNNNGCKLAIMVVGIPGILLIVKLPATEGIVLKVNFRFNQNLWNI